jgi:hypothetical protein
LFVLVGIGGLWFGRDHPLGTSQRPGTGVLPLILCWCLISTGGLLWLKAALLEGPSLTGWAWRPCRTAQGARAGLERLIGPTRSTPPGEKNKCLPHPMSCLAN